jgi:hypothetical protein
MPAQIESSSEDAADADDNDDDFEPEGGHKRARKQPARIKVGSAAEVIPVVTIDSRPIGSGSVGSITKKLSDAFKKLVHSK